jgi:hypothetical protein
VDESERLERLKKILELQKQIASEQEHDASTISVGTASTGEFFAGDFEGGSEDKVYSSSVTNTMLKDTCATIAPDTASVEASVASIEKLFTALGNCNIALSDINAKSQDLSLIMG